MGSSSNHASNEGRRQRPIARTRFIGREEELRRLTQLVPDERLVTLLGVGGVGKTRLILEAIPRVRERFAGGVEVVELAGLTDPDLLLVAIAAAVGVRASSTGDLVDAFQERFEEPTLVVLDNFERILTAGASLSQLLDVCPRLHIVVTSRAALRLTREREFVIGPLAIPPERWERADLEPTLSIDSVALFIDRARARGLEVPLADDDLSAVVEICRRLGGWPLAAWYLAFDAVTRARRGAREAARASRAGQASRRPALNFDRRRSRCSAAPPDDRRHGRLERRASCSE